MRTPPTSETPSLEVDARSQGGALGRDPTLDALCRRAAALFDAPMAMITQTGPEGLAVIGSYGIDVSRVLEEPVFCTVTLRTEQPLVVPDAAADLRFRDTGPVVGSPHVRFYAGVPLGDRPGGRVGTLCIADRVPRVFGSSDLVLLERLATRAAAEVWARLATEEPGRILID